MAGKGTKSRGQGGTCGRTVARACATSRLAHPSHVHKLQPQRLPCACLHAERRRCCLDQTYRVGHLGQRCQLGTVSRTAIHTADARSTHTCTACIPCIERVASPAGWPGRQDVPCTAGCTVCRACLPPCSASHTFTSASARRRAWYPGPQQSPGGRGRYAPRTAHSSRRLRRNGCEPG